MFKKVLSLVLAAMMLCALSVTAFAERETATIDGDVQNYKDVDVQLSSGTLPDQKIYVDVAWEKSALRYSFGTWGYDATAEKYDYLGSGWEDDGVIEFTLTNNSNCKVDISGELKRVEEDNLPSGVHVELSDSMTLESFFAANENAKKGTLTLTINGFPNEKINGTVRLGVKINVSAHDDTVVLK